MTLPTYTAEEAGDYIAHGQWVTTGGLAYDYLHFDVTSGDTLTVYLGDLNSTERVLAEAALEAWTTVTGIIFEEVDLLSSIDLDFYTTGTTASAGPSGFNPLTDHITSSVIQIGTLWTNYYGGEIGDYSFQTYLHEIGHALGLGHAGNYNGTADFDSQAVFANDSWQMSVMSYFSADENTNVTGDLAYVVTPMIADIEAMKILYGLNPEVHEGNTVWGVNSNIGGYLGDLFEDFANDELAYAIALTIQDTGGIDTLNLKTVAYDQIIDLREAAISSIGGASGNVVIANGTVIENVIGGSGIDDITGNDADNNLKGRGGDDIIEGGDGADTLIGGAGSDTIEGGAGDDTINGSGGIDDLSGGDGNDTINGAAGSDDISGGIGNDGIIGGVGSDTISGGAGDDDVSGGGGRDTIDGDNGNDIVDGNSGNDTIDGGAGNDEIDGGTGHDEIIGGNGHDTLGGGSGKDDLSGGAGNDIIEGGSGNDDLSGGAGADEFVFNSGFGKDVIADFDTSADTLTLDSDIWGGGLDVAGLVDLYGDFAGGNAELDFGADGRITFTGVTSLDDIEATITIV